MTFEQLRTFFWVARLGGVRRAAEQMHLSQPAVSARIAALETALGAVLFERAQSGMRLTKRGEKLLVYAEQIHRIQEDIKANIVDPAGLEAQLRVGVSETVVQSWLPEFVAGLRSEYPMVDVEITVDVSHNLRDSLLNRSLDLAILMGPISEFSVDNIELPAFELVWIRSPALHVDGDEADILRSTPVISYARNTRPYQDLKTKLLENVGSDARLFPSSSLSACIRMVATGLGVGAFPLHLIKRQLYNGELVAFDPGWRPDTLRFTASFLGEPKSHLAESVAHIAKDVAAAYME
ncbi:MAG: LysR family transcriptional regulator [Hyphomicrobiales bacterium]|nr:LysR family transcriptional regulator [Hyphomicrobiales bacterium]MCP5002078.1 LysR family transcriptional regulator [Hyphomicrobiales bacterium]